MTFEEEQLLEEWIVGRPKANIDTGAHLQSKNGLRNKRLARPSECKKKKTRPKD